MDNILNEFLGLDIKELANKSDELNEKRKEIAIAIVKLIEYPEWQVFTSELERMLKEIDKPCEYYASRPEQAKYDAGAKQSIQIIQQFVNSQSKILEKYAKKEE